MHTKITFRNREILYQQYTAEDTTFTQMQINSHIKAKRNIITKVYEICIEIIYSRWHGENKSYCIIKSPKISNTYYMRIIILKYINKNRPPNKMLLRNQI